MFQASELSALAKAIVPEGKQEAIMGTVDKEGAQVVVGISLGANREWEIQGQFEHKWSGDNDGKVKVLWSK